MLMTSTHAVKSCSHSKSGHVSPKLGVATERIKYVYIYQKRVSAICDPLTWP